MANKTSPCTTLVLNLRKTPRVPGAHVVGMETEAEVVLLDCNKKHTLLTKARIMSMLTMIVIPKERRLSDQSTRYLEKEGSRQVQS